MAYSQYVADATDKILTTGLYVPTRAGDSYHIEINGHGLSVRILCDSDAKLLAKHAEAFRHLAGLLESAALLSCSSMQQIISEFVPASVAHLCAAPKEAATDGV